MKAQIRKGEAKDLPATLGLIKELAEYEKAKDEVEVTLEQMEAWAFGPHPVFDFFVATVNNEVKGMALYYYKYSTWKGRCLFLEDLIVTEKARGNGYGKLLFDEVVKVAKQKKVKRLEWQVLEWNDPAISFYKKYNSKFDPEWINCKLTDDQLELL
jgi:GNAT superfamily N-acetyltransferase